VTFTQSILVSLSWTLLISLGSTAFALVLGLPMGYWIRSLPVNIRKLVAPILALPFFLPSLLIGVIAVPFLNRDETSALNLSLTLIAIQGFINVGFVALTVHSTLAGFAAGQREAAVLEGASNLQIALRIEVPQLRGPLAAIGTLVALYSATNYSLATLIGRGYVSTLEIEIAKFAFQEINYSAALVVGLVHLVLTAALFLVAARFGGNSLGLSMFGEAETQSRVPRPRLKGSLLQLAGAIFTALVILGLLSPVVRSVLNSDGLTVENFANLSSRGERDILDVTLTQASLNSLRNLLLTMVIALPTAWLLARIRGRSRRVARAIGIWPAAISPVVLGLAVLVFASQLGMRATETWLLLPATQALVILPLLTLVFGAAYDAMDADLLDAASVDGAGRFQSWLLVELPSLRAPISSGILFASLAALGEFSAASFLTVGSQTTLPVAIYQLAARPGPDNIGMAMAAASVFIGFALVVLLVQRRIAQS